MNHKTGIPQLRFKEFDSQWESHRIDNVAKKVTSGSRDWAQYYADSGDKFIRMTNLPKKGINLLMDDLKYVKLPEESSEGKRTSLDSGDILISITAELGKIGWVPNNLGLAYINQHTALIKLKSKVDSKYVAYQLSTNKNNIKLNRLNDSGAKSGLNLSTIRTFLIPFPALPEQQKIASFLSAVDERIQLLSRKNELLAQYKKGLMQQLFSGKLRFKDVNGNDYADWEEKKLGAAGKFISGTGFTEKEQGGSNGFPFLKVSDMNLANNKILMTESNNYVTEEQVKRMKYRVITSTSIIFAKVGAAIFLERKRIAKNFLIDNNMMAFIPLGNIGYHYHLFNNIRLSKYAQVGALPSYNSSDLAIIKILIPCLEEQQKIADFLSSIDTKIESVNQHITQTQTFKKGLLQQLFV